MIFDVISKAAENLSAALLFHRDLRSNLGRSTFADTGRG